MHCETDFTSSNYLGIRHSSFALKPWGQLTTGKPSGLHESYLAKSLARRVAKLQGLESGILYPSSFHLFWDLFDVLSKIKPLGICIDSQSYPVARWGVQAAVSQGSFSQVFSPFQLDKLRQYVHWIYRRGFTPVILTDGWCMRCGGTSPLKAYSSILNPVGGMLLVDDTQAIGVLGARPSSIMPYGYHGGGTLPWLDLNTSNLIVGSSLAKGFGVPIAVMSGSKDRIGMIKDNSLVRWHNSPPSAADLMALSHALKINKTHGGLLRQNLWKNVKRFRQLMDRTEWRIKGGIFPQQNVTASNPRMLDRLYFNLRFHKVCTLISNVGCKVILRADSSLEEIESLTNIMKSTSIGSPQQIR